MKSAKLISVLLSFVIIVSVFGVFAAPNTTEAFVQKYEYSEYDPPGVFSGVWHGLLAPYSLVARWFMDDGAMYAVPNTGWFYDAGFLIGIVGSIPIGWAAAIISTIGHILS
ncbi:MAG: hypothetical protein AAB366_02210 [Patescibacteria group bacterium]